MKLFRGYLCLISFYLVESKQIINGFQSDNNNDFFKPALEEGSKKTPNYHHSLGNSEEVLSAIEKENQWKRIKNTLNDDFCVRRDPSSKIFSDKKWIHAGLKSTVKIDCRVCGVADNCMYTVHWRKDGELLSNFPSLRIHSFMSYTEKHLYSLEIKNIRNKDYGVYSCVYNTTQGDNHTASTEISGIPYPAVWDQVVSTDKAATLSWRVNCSTYIINYQLEFRESLNSDWIMFNIPAIYANTDEINYREPLPESNMNHYQNYTIRGLKQDTTYQARIKSRNFFGESNLSKTFKFRTKPSRLRSYLKTKKQIKDIQSDQSLTKKGFYIADHTSSTSSSIKSIKNIFSIIICLFILRF